jgi:hypothetical protein
MRLKLLRNHVIWNVRNKGGITHCVIVGMKKRKRIDLDKAKNKELARMWARRQYFKEHMDKFLEWYKALDCNTAKAASKIKVNSSQVRSWRETMPWFNEAMAGIEDEVFGDAASLVFRKARRKIGDAKWLLLSHTKGRELGFGQRVSVDEKREVTLTMRMKVEQLKSIYSRNELEQLQKLLDKAPSENRLGGGSDAGANADRTSVGGNGINTLH